MKLAVIKTGGKQYLAEVGTVLTVEKFGKDLKKGDKVSFENVLLTDDGKSTSVGMPELKGEKVDAEVIAVGKGEKKVVLRYKAKSNYKKKKGHRQPFVKVKITSV
ncbi:MAG: 50S ribosomal protein L21 [Patescibacteria group bacterium]